MNPELLLKFQEKVYLRSNLHFPPQKTFLFKKRLKERIDELRLQSYEDYYEILDSNEEEVEKLLAILTNKETSFFRIMNHFEFLRDWLKNKEAVLNLRPSLKVWSAGCSTGEEAYSIAMIVLDTLKYPKAWDIEIIATDICYKAIKIAVEGRYDLDRIKGVPDAFREYVRINKDHGEAREEVKRLVRFERADIREERRKDFFDFIFCRNVLIYSDFEGQVSLIKSLYRALKPFGFLFTGEGEVLHLLPHPFKTIESEGLILYQKIPSKYEDISEKMESKDDDERLSAITKLGTFRNQESAILLLKATGDENWLNRNRAFKILLSFEDAVLFPALQKALRDNRDAALRNLSIEVFNRLGKRSLPTVHILLKDPDEEVRIFSVNILGNIKSPDSVPLLIETLHDSESNVRIASAEALGKIKDKRAMKPLIEALKGNLWMQFSAISALREMGDRETIEPLVKCIINPETTEPALAAVAEILRRAFYYESIPSLKEILKRNDIHEILREGLRSKDFEKKKTSLILLGWLRDKEMIPEMINMLSEDAMRDLAIETISLFGKEGIGHLRSQLKDPRIIIRISIEKIINRLGISSVLEDDNPLPLMNLLSDYSGIHLSKDIPINLKLRLAPALLRKGIVSIREYYSYLKDHPEELHEAVSCIANNETYFFREPKQLRIFSENILPEMAKERSVGAYGNRPLLRILSAGCSTGEEAYTIGILIEDSGIFKDWRIEILGIDIDGEAIEKAKKAYYILKSFRGMDENLLWKYFIHHGEGFIVREEIRKMTGFSQGNLLKPSPSLGTFDIIFCRNLIIYFTEHAIERTASILYDFLKDGGYLLLGSSESLSRSDHKFKTLRYPGAVVYKK